MARSGHGQPVPMKAMLKNAPCPLSEPRRMAMKGPAPALPAQPIEESVTSQSLGHGRPSPTPRLWPTSRDGRQHHADRQSRHRSPPTPPPDRSADWFRSVTRNEKG